MCGRFFIDEDFEAIYKRYDIQYEPDLVKDQSIIFPTQSAPVVIGSEQGNRIGYMSWGFTVPGVNRPVINGRTESIFEKASFKTPILKRRCIVPANGYYEWETDHTGKKIPFIIKSPENKLLSIGGIYTAFKDEQGNKIWQFSILTKPSIGVVSSIHDRMPILLDPTIESAWLTADLTPVQLIDIFKTPYRGLILEKVV